MTWAKLWQEFPVLPWQVIALGPRGADGWKVCTVNPQTCMMMPIPAHTEDSLVRCWISEFHWRIVWTLPCLSFHLKDCYKAWHFIFIAGHLTEKPLDTGNWLDTSPRLPRQSVVSVQLQKHQYLSQQKPQALLLEARRCFLSYTCNRGNPAEAAA